MESRRRTIDWPIVLFGLGAVLVVTTLFLPVIGKAKVDRRQALLQEEQFDHEVELKKLREKPGNDEKVRTAEETWTQRRETLTTEAKTAEFGVLRSAYIERYVMLAGFALLLVGGLAIQRSEANLVLRIFAATVLTVQLLLVFNIALGGCQRPI